VCFTCHANLDTEPKQTKKKAKKSKEKKKKSRADLQQDTIHLEKPTNVIDQKKISRCGGGGGLTQSRSKA